MINMIRADFYRMIRGVGIYFALALMTLMIAVSVYLTSPGNIGIHVGAVDEQPDEVLGQMTYEEFSSLGIKELREIRLKSTNYKLDKEILGSNINLYYIFLFAAVIIVTADFSGSCIKNTLSSAISRKKYFFSKVVFITGCCLILFFLNTYIMYFANRIFNGSNLASSLNEITLITLRQIPVVFALAGILSGFAFLLKRTALFNTVMIPFIMVGQTLLNLLILLFRWIPESIMNYELQRMFLQLAGTPSSGYLLRSYLVCGCIVAVSCLIGWFSFCKAEIR